MSLSAADVRRRGDQIRRRRTALVAGGAALAVAAVTVPILALAGNGGDPKSDVDRIAQDTSSLSANDLLRDADTEYFPNEKGAFTTIDTYEGDGQAAFHPCQQEKLSALGATDSLTRTFDWPGTEPTPGTGLVETIAEFEDDDAARAAYDTFVQWVVDCDAIAGAEEVNVVPRARSVDVPAGGDAVIYDLSWGPVPVEIDPYGDSAYINETGVIVQDDRIAVVAVTIIGQDYNFLEEDGGTPVNRMIPTAAERLKADGPASTEPAPGDPSEPGEGEGEGQGEAASVLAPGFDLVADMVTNDNGDPVVADPTAEGVGVLDFCTNIVNPGADAVERLAANASGPEYAEAREVIVTSSKADADALVATILGSARACPEPADVGSTSRTEVTTREDQPMPTDVITQTYLTDGVPQLGTTTWVVSRLGPIVFIAMTSSEGSPEPEALQQSTDEFLDRLATPFGWIVDSVGS